jgi:hypothetical protein
MNKSKIAFAYRVAHSRRKYLDSLGALYGDKVLVNVEAPKKAKVKSKTTPPLEYQLQIMLVRWAKLEGLDLISIPNSARRSFWQGKKEVAMGLTRGVSDLFLCHPVAPYAGFWIELKRKGRKPKPAQTEWLNKMRARGYRAEWYDDYDIAVREILQYVSRA